MFCQTCKKELSFYDIKCPYCGVKVDPEKIGDELFHKGEYAEAIECYTIAIEELPDEMPVVNNELEDDDVW